VEDNTVSFKTNFFPEFLTGVYLVLKITGVIDWSWWWIFSPIWLHGVFFVGLFIVAFIVFMTKEIKNDRYSNRFRR